VEQGVSTSNEPRVELVSASAGAKSQSVGASKTATSRVRVGWHTSPGVHAVAGTLAGFVVGAIDVLLAATREGLDPLETSETFAAALLGMGLNGAAGLMLGFFVGLSYWGLTRRVRPETLGRLLLSRRSLFVGVALGLVGVVGILVWADRRAIEWDAVDWTAPALLLAFGVLYLGWLWLQRWRLGTILTLTLLTLVSLAVIIGWPRTGEAGEEGLLRLGTETATSRHLLEPARRLFDGDGDSFPTALCRQDCDCDDASADIYPGAKETAANGIDEDCDGKDLGLAEVQQYRDALAPKSTKAPAQPEVAHHTELPTTPAAVTKAPSRVKNVLFITIDTLRADRLGTYGYPRATSKAIDALGARGVVFEQARSTGPQTRFSVPAFLTSKYFTELERTSKDWPKISDSETLLAERFSAAGYLTAAFHSIAYFESIYGMNQGFDHYDDSCIDARHPIQHAATSDYITDHVLAYVDSEEFKASTKPWYFWAYYGDPHSPYLFHDEVPKWGVSRKDAYDAEIAYTDLHIGRLLEGLESRGLANDLTIVLTSDHGEGIDPENDHGTRFHGPNLYDEAMHIPLLFVVPGVEPHRVKTAVSLIDLTPTFVDLLGAPPDPAFRGVSLKPYLDGENPEHPPLFFEKEKETALPQKGMLLWPYKVILVLSYNRYKIFDLEKDPHEQTDLSKTLPAEKVESMVGLLRYWSSQVLQPVEPVEHFR